jgi:hypothetical protein
MSPAVLESVATQRRVELAVVYADEQNLPGGVPGSWRWIETWRIADNFVCGGDAVFFFAVAPGADARLRASLEAFAPELPRTVVRVSVSPGVSHEPFVRAGWGPSPRRGPRPRVRPPRMVRFRSGSSDQLSGHSERVPVCPVRVDRVERRRPCA